jgi:hypothetical protein
MYLYTYTALYMVVYNNNGVLYIIFFIILEWYSRAPISKNIERCARGTEQKVELDNVYCMIEIVPHR